MLTNLLIFLTFYSSDLNDNQRIDSDGMIERTYYLSKHTTDNQLSFTEAFRQARAEKGPEALLCGITDFLQPTITMKQLLLLEMKSLM